MTKSLEEKYFDAKREFRDNFNEFEREIKFEIIAIKILIVLLIVTSLTYFLY
ncbi:hypothetical protein [Flavobacterium daemonense]|uniref:hypothetical protein n=1 Tax=Flavobacterium daemonense TaxID=1393049 RepID=UPI0013A601ED|nr:hypothetical protein [Flavobacterium daemonense]KAF2337219.1 hypothetical protein FND99_02060 [Flavobacterium daemonense]